MTQSPPSFELVFITALAAEARPIIDHYALSRCQKHHAFPLYRSKDKQVLLAVSGTGTLNAATATAYCAAQTHNPKAACFCNIGIAGGNQPIGSLWQCHKITDNSTQHRFYPTLMHSNADSTELVTCNNVQTQYPNNALVDMEASGFFHAASRFASPEQISVIKIVSDNNDDSRQSINPTLIGELLEHRLEDLKNHFASMEHISTLESKRLDLPQHWHDCLNAIRFSVTQQHQLKILLHRWNTVFKNRSPLTTTASRDSRVFLKTLEHELQQAPYYWT